MWRCTDPAAQGSNRAINLQPGNATPACVRFQGGNECGFVFRKRLSECQQAFPARR
jgi:hypothetical protein